MIYGVISDTHENSKNQLEYIVDDLIKRGVEMFVHCGDLDEKHVSKDLFRGRPVICAMVINEQSEKAEPFLKKRPDNWSYTWPDSRVTKLLDDTIVYVGHKKHLEFLRATEEKFNDILIGMRQEHDGLRTVFGGHLHFQTYKQGKLVSFINPGAVEGAIGWGYEYAVVDTAIEQVIFTRILPVTDDRKTFSVGVISDSLDVSHRDAKFWQKLADEFDKRGVQYIIHCGNIALDDIGRPELKHFTKVRYAIRADQKSGYERLKKASAIPENWVVISEENLDEKGAVVEINNYRFYVQLDLGLKFMTVSELGMDKMAMEIRRSYSEIEFVLCGFTREALLVGGQPVFTINPGDANTDRCFAVICLPRKEITFGHVPYDALPALT